MSATVLQLKRFINKSYDYFLDSSDDVFVEFIYHRFDDYISALNTLYPAKHALKRWRVIFGICSMNIVRTCYFTYVCMSECVFIM